MLHQKYALFCMKVDKNSIQNIEFRVVRVLYHYVPTIFSQNLKVLAPKIGLGTEHQDIRKKI